MITPLCQRMRSQGGYALPAAILMVTLVMMTGLATLSRGTTEQRMSRNKVADEQASYAALAGVEHCLGYLAYEAGPSGSLDTMLPGEIVCSKSSVTEPVYTVTAQAVSGSDIQITATGRTGLSAISVRTVTMHLYRNPLAPNRGISNGGYSSQAYGGGTVRISGTSKINGDLVSFGDITFAGNAKACGTYVAKGQVVLNTTPGVLDGCPITNRYLSNQRVSKVTFDEYLTRIPATLPTDLPGHNLYLITGDLRVKCAPPGSGAPREPNCDGPPDPGYATVVWVDGTLLVDKVARTTGGGAVQEQYFTGNVIFVARTGIDFKVKDITRADGPGGATTVLQFMALTGESKFTSIQNMRGHVVSLTGSVEILNTNITGIVIADTWTFNNSNLTQDSYLITKLKRTPALPSEDWEENQVSGMDDDSKEWNILGYQ